MGKVIVKSKISSHDTVSVFRAVPEVVRMFTVGDMGQLIVKQKVVTLHEKDGGGGAQKVGRLLLPKW